MRKIKVWTSNGTLNTTVDFPERPFKDERVLSLEEKFNEVKVLVLEEMIQQIYDIMPMTDRTAWLDDNYHIDIPDNFMVEIDCSIPENISEYNIMSAEIDTDDFDLFAAKVVITALEQLIRELSGY